MGNKNYRLKSYLTDSEAGFNISWGAIIAGVITFLSIFMTLGLIGSAIGFGTLKPTSSNPLDGVGTGLIIWIIITIALSLRVCVWCGSKKNWFIARLLNMGNKYDCSNASSELYSS